MATVTSAPITSVSWDGLLYLVTDDDDATKSTGTWIYDITTDPTNSTFPDDLDGTQANYIYVLTGILLVGLVTNSIIIAVVVNSSKLRSVFFYLLASLAMSHIICSTAMVSLAITKTVLDGDHEYMPHICHAWHSLTLIYAASTLIHMLLNSLHALLMLSFPVCYRKSSLLTKTLLQVGMAWILPIMLVSPFVVVTSDSEAEDSFLVVEISSACLPVRGHTALVGLVPMYYLPLVFVLAMYVTMAIRMKQTSGMASRMASQRHGELPPGLQKEPRIIVKDEESHVCNSDSVSLASGQEYEPYSVDAMVAQPLTNHLAVALHTIPGSCSGSGTPSDSLSQNSSDNSSFKDMTYESIQCNPMPNGLMPNKDLDEHKQCNGHGVVPNGKEEVPNVTIAKAIVEVVHKLASVELNNKSKEELGNKSKEDEDKDDKSGEDNKPQNKHTYTPDSGFVSSSGSAPSSEAEDKASLMDSSSEASSSSQGEINLGYEDSLSDMQDTQKQERMNDPSEDVIRHQHVEIEFYGTTGNSLESLPEVDEMEIQQEDGTKLSSGSSSHTGDLSQEEGEGQEGHMPKRTSSILRREGSSRPSKKVRFDSPHVEPQEKRTPRIKRKPTGYRRDTSSRTTGGQSVIHQAEAGNGCLGPPQSGLPSSPSPPLWLERNGKLSPASMEETVNTEYLVRVNKHYGRRLSQKVKVHRINMTLLCFLLLVFTLLAAPYMLVATTYAFSQWPHQDNFSDLTISVLEWLLIASSTVNLALCVAFSEDFRMSMGKLYCKSKCESSKS